MYIVKYSELVHMAEMHSQARASSPYELLSHIVTYITRGNPKFVYVILSFPPLGYQPARADNRKSCVLNGKVITCMRRKPAMKFVTSD